MSRSTIKYCCLLTLILMFIYTFFPAFLTIQPSAASASDVSEKDIYKGLGIALFLILVSKLGQSHEHSSGYDNINRPDPDINFQDGDIDLLAKIIHGEARGEPYKGQVAVGAVVLNRVKSPEFPNSLRGVIYQENQFSAVVDGQINLVPSNTSYQAARDALNGIDPSFGALFFYNPKKAKTLWWLSSRETTVIIGDHVFAR